MQISLRRIFIRPILALLYVVERESRPFNLALGAFLGFCLGVTPMNTLQWPMFLLSAIIFRFHPLAVVTSGTFFHLLTPALDPLFHKLGYRFLVGSPTLYPVHSWVSHIPIVPFTEFTNTVVLGVSIATVFIALPIFLFLGFVLSKQWDRFQVLQGTRFWMFYTCSSLHRSYERYRHEIHPKVSKEEGNSP